jgi:hypothetical protein
MPPLSLLAPVLEALAPLFKKRDTYYLLLIVLLALAFMHAKRRADGDELALAARPKVETRVDVHTVTKTVQGPERVVEKVVKGEVVERVVYKDQAVTTTEAQKDYDRTTAPACPAAAPAPWRYAGVLADPFAPTKLVGLRGGVTLWNRVDLGISGRFSPRAEGAAEVGVRF